MASDTWPRQLIECEHCQHVVPAPSPLDFPSDSGNVGRVLPRGVLSLDLKFLCSSCKFTLEIDARCEGLEVECPQCRQSTLVPRWSREAHAAVSLTTAEIDFLTEHAGLNDQVGAA
ncbi:MAG: hypothetical protein M3O82_06740 [Verrucomicrobiota bacterium]|nr:hypothetical protein [Verrucomicrobiota bacterium]